MEERENCITCRQPKAQHHCGICEEGLCRSCAMFLDEVTFSFLSTVPEELKHSYYCQGCHEAQVEPALAAYNAKMEEARGVYFFFNSRKKPVQTLKKSRETVAVKDCVDRDETILRLGFMAAEQGFNALINAEVICDKVRDHGWQKMSWRGEGLPVDVDAEKLERHGDPDDY